MAPYPPGAPLGLYLHIPFCAHICPYCDFNTYAGQDALIPRYVDALDRQISRLGGQLQGRAAATIFFGGGTPSLLPPEAVCRLVHACRDAFAVEPGAEVTIEANPNSVDAAYFAGLLNAGVNRLSLGVQTLQRRGLRHLGRQHEAEDAQAAYIAAREAGFTNISLDLIFGWPGHSVEAWRDDLDRVLNWPNGGPEHLSLYSLIVEPGTPLADGVKRGIISVPDDDQTADLYELAIERLGRAGWSHYEIANWARSPELASRHNSIYWRNGDYVGLGAGAYGCIAGRRYMNQLLPLTYIKAIEGDATAESNSEELSPQITMGETMMLGLRLLNEGVDDEAFQMRHGQSLTETFGPTIDEFVAIGMLERRPGNVRLTHRGMMLANDVCARFL